MKRVPRLRPYRFNDSSKINNLTECSECRHLTQPVSSLYLNLGWNQYVLFKIKSNHSIQPAFTQRISQYLNWFVANAHQRVCVLACRSRLLKRTRINTSQMGVMSYGCANRTRVMRDVRYWGEGEGSATAIRELTLSFPAEVCAVRRRRLPF